MSCPKWQCWVAIGLLLLSGGSAAAQSMHDPHTGLGVAPPAGYSARAAPSRSRYSAVIDVKRENDHDTGCKLGFQPVPQNRNYSQSEINTLAMKPERQSIIEAILGTLYQVSAIDAVEHQGVHGAVATATLKQLPGLPTRAGEMVSLFYLLETPAGRTMLVCVAERQNLQARRREFDAVLQGVTLPR